MGSQRVGSDCAHTFPSIKKNNFIYLFIYLFVFGCTWSSLLHMGFLWLLRARTTLELRCTGFSLWWFPSGAQARGGLASAVAACRAQWLWHVGPVALQHVESSQTRDRTRVPCIGRRSVIHCTTREVHFPLFLISFLDCRPVSLS